MEITDSLLLIDSEKVASWTDKYTAQCKVSVTFNGKTLKSGDILQEAGKLTVIVTNEQGKKSSAEILLINEAISGLGNVSLQVDQETDLLE